MGVNFRDESNEASFIMIGYSDATVTALNHPLIMRSKASCVPSRRALPTGTDGGEQDKHKLVLNAPLAGWFPPRWSRGQSKQQRWPTATGRFLRASRPGSVRTPHAAASVGILEAGQSVGHVGRRRSRSMD